VTIWIPFFHGNKLRPSAIDENISATKLRKVDGHKLCTCHDILTSITDVKIILWHLRFQTVSEILL
jgi:hypothetical protein